MANSMMAHHTNGHIPTGRTTAATPPLINAVHHLMTCRELSPAVARRHEITLQTQLLDALITLYTRKESSPGWLNRHWDLQVGYM